MVNEDNSFAGISRKSYADDSGFKVSLGIDHKLEERLYNQEVMDLLKTEQEKFNDLKTFLIMYERDLQFYKLLILVSKALKSENLTLTASKQSSVMNAIMKSVIILLKNKEVLFNNEFVKKLINYEVMKVIEFISKKEDTYRTTDEMILQLKESNYVTINAANKKDKMLIGTRDSITQENFEQRMQEIESEELENFVKLIDTCVEVQSERESIDSLKVKCLPNMMEILSCRAHVNHKLVVGLMQKLGKISRVDMVYVRQLVRYLVFGTNIKNMTLSLLLDKLKDPLKNVLFGIKEHFVDSEQEDKSRSSRQRDKEEYQKIALIAKPFLAMMLPTKEICDICQEICDTLNMRFQKINKEIESLLCKTCTHENYKIITEKISPCIYSDMKSIYSFIQDCCMSTLTTGIDRKKLSDLCSQRDVVLDRISDISKLSCSAKKFPNIVCDFLTDDCVNYERALLESRGTLKQMSHYVHHAMKCGESCNDTVVILKDHVTCINDICHGLLQELDVLEQKVYPVGVGSKGVSCFCLCSNTACVQ